MQLSKYFKYFRQAVKGEQHDFVSGSINKAIFMLSIPMILEMVMESLFAVVDIYFVGKVSVNAVATVALTESVIMIVYALAIGLSMAATAVVARRIGEKQPEKAATAGVQAIIITVAVSLIFSIVGLLFAKDILFLMGGEQDLIEEGYKYTMVMLGGNFTVMLLFLINAIFRGAVIKYKEYISVGKARDVGFAQINGFEAKVSGVFNSHSDYMPSMTAPVGQLIAFF